LFERVVDKGGANGAVGTQKRKPSNESSKRSSKQSDALTDIFSNGHTSKQGAEWGSVPKKKNVENGKRLIRAECQER